jgi:hypothetical protein
MCRAAVVASLVLTCICFAEPCQTAEPRSGWRPVQSVAEPTAPADPLCDPVGPSAFAPPLLSELPTYSLDNASFFMIGEGFRLNAQHRLETRAAGRVGANWGVPVFGDDQGLGVQLGGSASLAGGGEQFFVSTGVFYRDDVRLGSTWNAGAVVDWIDERNDEIDVFQLRPKTSITLDPQNEAGVWAAFGLTKDTTDDADTARTVDQVNLFYRHLCPNHWDLTGWAGLRNQPDSAAVGGDATMPMSDCWALTTGGHWGFAADTWHLYLGAVRYLGGRAAPRYIGQFPHQPYLPVADNTSMTVAIDK